MKIKITFFIAAILFSKAVSAVSSDSLVKFGDLSFKNSIEKNTLVKFSIKKESADIVDLFLISYDTLSDFNSADVHKKIDDCVLYLKKETQGKSEIKRIKFIYDYVHKTFFNVYKLKNSFCNIFTKGEYNCVSASALYAIIFSKLSIPYQIKETPEHVYLVADPNTEKILIETTSPERGYYQFNDNFVEKYVKSLYNSKQITKEEYSFASMTELFNKYYYSSSDVSLIELAGLQYSNYCIYGIDDKNYDAAMTAIKKAYYLFPAARNKYLLRTTLIFQVSNNDYNDMKAVSDLALLCRFNNLKDEEINDAAIKDEFVKIMQKQLIKNSDYDKFNKSYELISEAINDTVLKNEITFDYNYELARLGYGSRSSEYEISHLSSAYRINPHHADLQVMIISYFGKDVETANNVAGVMELAKSYSDKFDFLNDRREFIVVEENCMLELAYQEFSLNNISNGEKHLSDFETFCTKKSINDPGAAFVEKAYSTGSIAYYKKGNYARSKQLIKTGLIYAPNSFMLKQRLSSY